MKGNKKMSHTYMKETIAKYQHGTNHTQNVNLVKAKLDNIIRNWAGPCFNTTMISGSMAKGTSINLGSDFDLFVSIIKTTDTVKELYNKLCVCLQNSGFVAKKQNVSVGMTCDGLKVDVIPAKKCSGHTNDHSIYVSKLGTGTLTNIQTHTNLIKNSGRLDEIILTKIWSNLHNLDFPSFYLELSVLKALYGKPKNQPDKSFMYVLSYLSTSFINTKIEDPTNKNNLISDSLNKTEKTLIANKAKAGSDAPTWTGVIW